MRAEAEAEPSTTTTAADAPSNHGTAPTTTEQQPAGAEQQAEQKAADWELPEVELAYEEPSGGQKAWTNVKLAFALPWRRFKSESVLTLKLSGQIAEQPQVGAPATVAGGRDWHRGSAVQAHSESAQLYRMQLGRHGGTCAATPGRAGASAALDRLPVLLCTSPGATAHVTLPWLPPAGPFLQDRVPASPVRVPAQGCA